MKAVRIILLISLIMATMPAMTAQARPADAALLAGTSTPTVGPLLLAPAAGSMPDMLRPVFDWEDVAGATSYQISASTYSNFAFFLAGYNNVTVTASTYTASLNPTDLVDLPRNVPIYWRVRVLSPTSGPWSIGSFTAPNPPYSPNPVSPGRGTVVVSLMPTLTWTPSATPLPDGTTFAYYQLQVDDGADFSAPLINSQVSGLSYTFTQALAASSTVYWRIRTANTLGQFSIWRTSNFITSLAAPTLLSPGTDGLTGGLRPRLDWSDVTGATGYGLEVSFHSDFSSPVISVATGNSEYTPLSDLPPSTQFYWRVRTHGANISDWSSSTFTTPALNAITATPTPTATPTVTQITVTLTPTATGTRITVTPTITATASLTRTPTVTGTVNITTSPTVTLTTTISVSPTRTITATPTRTRTSSPTGSITLSPTSTLTRTATISPTATVTRTITATTTRTLTPKPVVKPVLLAPAAGSIPDTIRPLFDWADLTGATAYAITVSTYSNFAFPLVDTTVTASKYVPTADLTRNVTIYWRVREVSPVFSAWAVSSFKAPNPPYSPPPVSPGLNALVTDLTPVLDWGPSVFPAGTTFAFYQLQLDDNSNFSSPLVDFKQTDSAKHAYTVTTALTSNATYYWRIRTANTLNQNSIWRTSKFRTALRPPVLLAPAALSTPDNLRPLFDWSDVAGATGYGLEASVHADFSAPVISVAVTASTYQPAADLPRGVVIYWRVRAQGTNMSAWRASSFNAPNPPNTLVLVSPLQQQVVQLNPTLNWNAAVLPAGTTFAYYQLRLSINNNPDTPIFNITLNGIGKHQYTFIDQSVINPSNGQYYWHVRAANTAGQLSTWASRAFLLSTTTVTPTRTPTPTRTLTPTVTRTPTPVALGRLYQNNIWGFKFAYPDDATLDNQTNDSVQMHFTIMPGTNLGEKYLQAGAYALDGGACQSSAPTRPGATGVTEVINGISFLHQEGQDFAVGNVYDWVAYSAVNGNICTSLLFILHSGNPDNYYPTPPPLFDKAGESQVFSQIMHTFAWIPITITPTPGSFGPYAAAFVPAGQSLVVHSAAGDAQPVVATLSAVTRDLMVTGQKTTMGADTWSQIHIPGGSELGWVNSYYLTEQVSAATFAADPQMVVMVNTLKEASNNSNDLQLAGILRDPHGLDVRVSHFANPVHYSVTQAYSIFSSPTVIDWGPGPGMGADIIGSFSDQIRPRLLDTLNGSYQLYPNDSSLLGGILNTWPYPNVNYVTVFRPGAPGNELDWRAWLVGIEYINGHASIVALIQYQWEP
jgi:hypothetical protein